MRSIARATARCFPFVLFVIFASTSVFATPAFAQSSAGTIAGKVISAAGAAVHDATVEVVGTRRRAATDPSGAFRIDGLPSGNYLVQAESPRYGTGAAQVTVAAGAEAAVEMPLDLAIHREEIVVTGSPGARRLEESYQPADVLDSADLQAKLQPTLGETLAQQPGVSSTAFGQGASRPVVRGFEGDRIRILDKRHRQRRRLRHQPRPRGEHGPLHRRPHRGAAQPRHSDVRQQRRGWRHQRAQ